MWASVSVAKLSPWRISFSESAEERFDPGLVAGVGAHLVGEGPADDVARLEDCGGRQVAPTVRRKDIRIEQSKMNRSEYDVACKATTVLKGAV